MNSKLHTQKNIVTVGDFVDMVNNQNWKRDVSFILVEDYDEGTRKWKERENLDEVSGVAQLKFDAKAGTLSFITPQGYYEFSGLKESALMQELTTADRAECRCTIYMT